MRHSGVAVVTGAGSGIGRAIAERLAAEDYTLVGADVAWPAGDARPPCDVSDPDQVTALFEDTVRTHGRVDVLVNAAGVDLVRPILELTDTDWERVLRINLFGTFLCLRAAGRLMCAQGGGRIVNIASNRGLGGLASGAPYAASKGGVLALTKSAAEEFRPAGVGVFALLPGATDTPMLRGHRGGHVNSPEQVAAAVMPLLAPDALAFNGAALSVSRQPGPS
ncbi:MAG TPA: SDR family oxidoreductase [Actinophytocola sp.]|jgi:NAD(P)-dependent dehydrogenase (short-subunit alcohol dehydrogenase family)|nr:SDR family oxidoreductase [Actinophytocola sp.]